MNSLTKNTTPLVSIIIPTYNHAQFLTKALSSVIAQTLTDWEAIVVNNYSTDNTIEIIQSFNDSRIKIINFHNNGIIASSRNIGIKNATGTFLAFLDSDDSWLPRKLEISLNYIKNHNADLVCNDEVLIENDKVISTWHHAANTQITYQKLLLKGNCISTSAVTVKRQAVLDVGLFNEEQQFVTAEDYELWLKLARAGCQFNFIPEVLGKHLKHSTNNSGSVLRHFEAVKNVTEYHFNNMPQSFFLSINKELSMGILYYGVARQAADQNMLQLSLKFYAKSLRQNPFRAKTYAGVLLLWIRYLKSLF